MTRKTYFEIEFINPRTWEIVIPLGQIEILNYPTYSNNIEYVYSFKKIHPIPIQGKGRWTEFEAKYIDLEYNYGAYFFRRQQPLGDLFARIYENQEELLSLDKVYIQQYEIKNYNDLLELEFTLSVNNVKYNIK